MFGKHFELNGETMHIAREIGMHMPGGFFIYKAPGIFWASSTISLI